MANLTELTEAVLREYEAYKSSKHPYCYNTGYGGRGRTSGETASMSDLETASGSLKDKVAQDHGVTWAVRVAKSYSGETANEWSILIEIAGKAQPVFNFHMGIA